MVNNKHLQTKNEEDMMILRDVLPVGEENSISLKDLSTICGVTEREMKSHILYMRQNQNLFFIASLPSEQKGYYIPSTREEALRCLRMFEKRAETTDSILKMMRECIYRNYGEEGSNYEETI